MHLKVRPNDGHNVNVIIRQISNTVIYIVDLTLMFFLITGMIVRVANGQLVLACCWLVAGQQV